MPKMELTPSTDWTKDATARGILDCQKELIEIQIKYFGLIKTLEESGKYKRASDTIKKLLSDIKNHNLLLQALLLEFDGGIPIDEEDMDKTLNDLKNAMQDTEEE